MRTTPRVILMLKQASFWVRLQATLAQKITTTVAEFWTIVFENESFTFKKTQSSWKSLLFVLAKVVFHETLVGELKAVCLGGNELQNGTKRLGFAAFASLYRAWKQCKEENLKRFWELVLFLRVEKCWMKPWCRKWVDFECRKHAWYLLKESAIWIFWFSDPAKVKGTG